MRYNRICRLEECTRWRREDDVLCRKHYLALPEWMRRLLWEEDPQKLAGNIALALNWLDEKEGGDV